MIERAEIRGFEVVDLADEGATKRNFIEYMREYNPDIVIIGTHGQPDFVVGQWEEPLVQSCDVNTERLLIEKHTYYLACLAGQKLAKTTQEKGARMAIGYLPEYIWFVDTNYPPEEDPVAKPFGECAIEPALGLIDGLPPRQIYERTMAKYDMVEKEMAKDPSPEAALRLNALENNREGLIIYSQEEVIRYAPSPVFWLVLGGLGLGALYLWRKR